MIEGPEHLHSIALFHVARTDHDIESLWLQSFLQGIAAQECIEKIHVPLNGHRPQVGDYLFMIYFLNLQCRALLLSFTYGQLYGESSTGIQLALYPDISIVALDNAIAYRHA